MSIALPELRASHPAGRIQIGPLRSWTTLTCDLPIVGLPPDLDGFRLLHLSDTHLRARWHPSYDRLLAEVESLDVNLIAFTGDWVDDKFDHRPGLPTALRFARGLRSRLGVFSCLGNHDGDLIAPYLIDVGIRVLVGELVRIVGGDGSIEIVGLPGVAREDLSDDLIASFGQPATDAFRLLLTHFPDHLRRIGPLTPHLMLAGHTHGGQVCKPGGNAIISHDSLPKRFASGLHRVDDTWLHVSRGLGCTMWQLRVYSPPQITVFRLTRF